MPLLGLLQKPVDPQEMRALLNARPRQVARHATTVRPFLKAAVPDALRLAALRKAWSTDSEIAGFRGFADYDWDFNAPGYGKLLPIDDIRKLCDAIFGDQPEWPTRRAA